MVPRPSLRPVAITFFLFGAFWGAWAVSTADVERSLRFSHAEFGLLLSAALLAGASANAIVGPLCDRWGTGPTLIRSLAVWGTLLAAGAATRAVPVFAVLVVGVVAGAGAVDVVMNVAATAAFADRPGRLVRFHALFNAGAALGALATGLLLHSGASWRWVWLGGGAGAATLALAFRHSRLPSGEPGERHHLTHGLRVLRREGLVLLAVAFAAGAMVEGGIDTWGVLYLREHLATGVLLGAAAATCGYAVAAAGRATLGPAVGSVGSASGVAVGAGLAGAGLILLALASQPAAAAMGLVVAAVGVSMCWPLLLATAAAGREHPGAVVGGVAAMGYLGMVVGPALVGWLAGAFGLRVGLLALAVAAAFVAATPGHATRRTRAAAAPSGAA